ncbi:hypothetical protein ACQ4PT_038370 [Festuca glaucescens]
MRREAEGRRRSEERRRSVERRLDDERRRAETLRITEKAARERALAERQRKEDLAATGNRDRWAHRQEMAGTRADSSANSFATAPTSSIPQQTTVMSSNKGRPLPKFGEWDVKNPATADGFTVIFQKARDNKKTTGPGQSGIPPAFRNANGNGYRYGSGSEFKSGNSYPYSRVASPKRVKKKWVFCGSF